MGLLREAKTFYSAFRSFYLEELTVSDEDTALEKYVNTRTRYTDSEVEFFSRDEIEAQMKGMELPEDCELSPNGAPVTDDDREAFYSYIQEQPVEAAINVQIIKRALEEDIDIQEHLGD